MGLSLGLAVFMAVVYPLAYVVSRYTCRDRSQEIEYTDHDIPPFLLFSIGVDSKSIIPLFPLARPSNDFLRNFPHVTAY